LGEQKTLYPPLSKSWGWHVPTPETRSLPRDNYCSLVLQIYVFEDYKVLLEIHFTIYGVIDHELKLISLSS